MNHQKIEWLYNQDQSSNQIFTIKSQPIQEINSEGYKWLINLIPKEKNSGGLFSRDCDVPPQEEKTVELLINESQTNSTYSRFICISAAIYDEKANQLQLQTKMFEGVRMSQGFYKSIIKKQLILQDSRVSGRLSESFYSCGDETMIQFGKMECDSRELRLSSVFQARMKPLQEFSDRRAERVKDSESVSFFKDIQLVTETDAEGDLKCQIVKTQYPIIRQIRGDGNCLYSSLIFAYLEILLMQEDQTQLVKLMDSINDGSLIIHDIYLKTQQDIEFKVVLLPANYSRILLIQFLSQIIVIQEAMKKKQYLKKIIFYHLNQLILGCANETNGLYDILVALMRSIALNSFNQNKMKEPFSNFICEDVQLKENIETFEVEADYLILTLICEVLPIEVNIIQWDTENAMNNIQIIKSANQKQIGTVYLKYVPEHYDLVYTKVQLLEWFNYHTTFEYLDNGYCIGCDDFIEGKLLRLKRCSHSFCLNKNHLPQTSQQIKCPQQQCTVNQSKKMVNDFLALANTQELQGIDYIRFEHLY